MSAKSKSPSPRATRQTRKDFDKEPNPFEQSFSATPRSGSSNVRSSPKPESQSGSRPSSPAEQRSPSPRPVLPPIASISSPADPSYAWNYSASLSNSLRSGPLSPAMLAGPQPTADQQHMPFDAAAFRTGLTPGTGLTPRIGLTPATGLTPLVGVGVGTYPASPNTAFLTMMGSANSHPPANNPTITPNTLTAINSFQENGTSAPNPNGSSYIASVTNPANPPHNGLFLLSQAHQELEKRQQESQRQAGNAAPAQTNGRRGTKRKPYDPTEANGTTNGTITARAPAKRSRAAARRRSISMDDDDDVEDDEDVEDDGEDNIGAEARGRRNKKPETEEEKRKNFLERNRQAALKCRQRKKAWLTQLQAKVEYLSNENERLTSALVSSREEISRLNALVGGAAVVGGPGGAASVGGGVGPPVAMSVNLGPAATGKVTAGGRGGGYGY